MKAPHASSRLRVPTAGTAVGLVVGLMVASLLGCAHPPYSPLTPGTAGVAQLPLQLAWHAGQQVEYLTTDASDATVARELGANHAPLLAAAAAPTGSPPGTRSAVDRVYAFAQREQANVFGSAPQPAGAGNTQRAYTPLWRMVVVHWHAGHTPHLLDSEEAVLAAEERGELRLEVTAVVVNCPVVRAADGSLLPGVRTWR
jgi:hypothetical protein